MNRKDLMKRISGIAKAKDVEMTTRQGGQHEVVLFAGRKVTTVPRHNEINENTARGCIKAAESFTKGD